MQRTTLNWFIPVLRNSSDFWCSFEINDTITLHYRYPHMQNDSAAIWDTAAKQLQKCHSFLFPPNNEHFITSCWPVHFQTGLVFLQQRPLWNKWASLGDPHCYRGRQNMLQAGFPGRSSILLSNHQPVQFLPAQRCPWEASLLMCMYNTDALCTCSTPSTFIHDWLSRHANKSHEVQGLLYGLAINILSIHHIVNIQRVSLTYCLPAMPWPWHVSARHTGILDINITM